LPRLSSIILVLAAACGGTNAPSADRPSAALTATAAGKLALTIATPDHGQVGVPLAFTATVANESAFPATGVLVGYTFPSTAQIGGAIPTECARKQTSISCLVGDIAPGASASLTLSVIPTQVSLFDVFANDGGTLSGLGYTTTSLNLVVPIDPAPTDVQVTGFASTGSPPAGSAFTYTFQVKNNGPAFAYGVTFDDALPSALAFAGVTSSAGKCAEQNGTIDCALGDLPVGGQANVVITAIAPATPQTVTDTASVASTWGDTHPANDAVSVSVQIK
jgi:uncharacterized repeat protein (TIGR01451 family)